MLYATQHEINYLQSWNLIDLIGVVENPKTMNEDLTKREAPAPHIVLVYFNGFEVRKSNVEKQLFINF